MFKCENCSKEHDGSYGSGRFCCKNCLKIWHLNDMHNSNRADFGIFSMPKIVENFIQVLDILLMHMIKMIH